MEPMMTTDTVKIDTDTVKMLAQAMPKIERLDTALEEVGYYLDGEIRLWHGDGWSPGYLSNIDGVWWFTFNYMER
jgi:hypothetical protein